MSIRDLGQKGLFHFIVSVDSSSLRGERAGLQIRNLEAGSDREAMEGHC